MLTTQYSLIHRLQDPRDQEAWQRFTKLYQPAIYRSLVAKGLQHADACDLVQQVFLAVSNALQRRPHDPDQARFRTWLDRVIRNIAINAVRHRARLPVPVETLDQLPIEGSSEEHLLEQEYQRQRFALAAQKVQQEVSPQTWQAFWRSAILGQEIQQVADDLQCPRGSIYAARSRIIRRLKREVEILESFSDSVSDYSSGGE